MPVMMAMVAVPPPVHLIDHLVGGGRMADDAADRGRGRGRRRADEGEPQGHQRNNEDCTHFNSLLGSSERCPVRLTWPQTYSADSERRVANAFIAHSLPLVPQGRSH